LLPPPPFSTLFPYTTLFRSRFSVDEGRRSGRLVAEINNIDHGYDDRVLIRDFSTAIMRGDRIGILGPNGAGKTTLLNIILGKLRSEEHTSELQSRFDLVCRL